MHNQQCQLVCRTLFNTGIIVQGPGGLVNKDLQRVIHLVEGQNYCDYKVQTDLQNRYQFPFCM